jgi:predicted nucleotidyltransferase component of viral defense system
MDNTMFPYPHDADPDVFREALAYSEATTGFTATLIERDYYCSLILQYFFGGGTSLVFKGGTCLSKVYADFYRLSEDLDFIIPVPEGTSRNQRRAKMRSTKRMFEELPSVIPGLTILESFKGHNEARQYIGYLQYRSMVIEKQEKVKIEVGLREPLLRPPVSETAHTIMLNPFTGRPLLPNLTVGIMTMREAYAEKVRAALTRKEPAIRDFFDVFYAVRQIGLDTHDPEFLSMVRAKLEVPGNAPIDVSPERKQELDRQLEGQLRPVLRPADFDRFNLDQAFEVVSNIADAISDWRPF